MLSMRRVVEVTLFGAVVAVGTLAVSSVMGARIEKVKSGAFLVDVTAADATGGAVPVMTMLTQFSRTGQVLSTDSSDEGFLPGAVSGILDGCAGKPGSPRPGERNGAGHGSWRADGLTIRFVVLSQRFASDGTPIGMLRASGQGAPQLDGTILGTSAVDYFGPGGDPLSDRPDCTFQASFTGRRIPDAID